MENHATDTDTASIGINYAGYNSGTTRFRDFYVYNGKNSTILKATGSTGSVDFLGGSGTTPAVRIKSGGSSWSEGLAIHPATNNSWALAFFRTTADITTNTNTWALGNLGANGTNDFGLLRFGLTGSSAIQGDAIFDVSQAGVFRFGFTPTVGSNTVLHTGNGKPSNDQNQVDINSPASSTGTWTAYGASDEWGNPKFDGVYNTARYADAPATVQYNIPAGMKSAWISQLCWSNGGYVDIHGVQSGGQLVFLRRINTRQAVENVDEGVNMMEAQ